MFATQTPRYSFLPATEKISALVIFAILLPALSYGQAVTGALENVKNWIVAIANILFVIVIVVGILKTVAGFVQGSPNAVRNLVLLIVAALVWFGFSLVVSDFGAYGGIDQI